MARRDEQAPDVFANNHRGVVIRRVMATGAVSVHSGPVWRGVEASPILAIMRWRFSTLDRHLSTFNRALLVGATSLLGSCVACAVLACAVMPANRWIRVYDPRDEFPEMAFAAGLTGAGVLRWFLAASRTLVARSRWIALDRAASAFGVVLVCAGVWVLTANRFPSAIARWDPLGALMLATAVVTGVGGWIRVAIGRPPRSFALACWLVACGWCGFIVAASLLPALHHHILMSSEGYCALVGACGTTLAAINANGVKQVS